MSTNFEKLDKSFMGHPKPLRGLFLVETWERFSYYGIRPLLILFMTAALASGGFGFDDATASAIYGVFAGMIYLAPLAGGWLADNWLGRERALWWGSFIMALGHLAIGFSAIESMGKTMFFIGLVLLVLGTGLFKTCIVAMIGSLYDTKDERRDSGFTIFYMGINLGGFLAPMITGLFSQQGMWHTGFTVGGVGMLVALLLYHFIGRKDLQEFAEARGIGDSWREPNQKATYAPALVAVFLVALSVLIALVATGVVTLNIVAIRDMMTYVVVGVLLVFFGWAFLTPRFDKADKLRMLVCFVLIISSALFWSSFEQQPTSFNLFAERYTDREIFGFQVPTVWFQSLNALFIIMFAPLLGWIWIKLATRKLNPNSMVKFAIAMFLTAAAFGLMILAAELIVSGAMSVSMAWLVSSLFLLTIGELCLSPVGVSSMTKLAPKGMSGVMIGMFYISISLGGLIGSISGGYVSAETINDLPKLFTVLTVSLVVVGVILLIVAKPIGKMLKDADKDAVI